MIVRSTLALFLLLILFIHTLNAINPEYFRQKQQEQRLSSLLDSIGKQLDDLDSSEKYENIDDNEDGDQFIKRNKYPNFHISPLWLSRRTRTNRFYGKPLWISRPG
jgi:hypothetical protein